MKKIQKLADAPVVGKNAPPTPAIGPETICQMPTGSSAQRRASRRRCSRKGHPGAQAVRGRPSRPAHLLPPLRTHRRDPESRCPASVRCSSRLERCRSASARQHLHVAHGTPRRGWLLAGVRVAAPAAPGTILSGWHLAIDAPSPEGTARLSQSSWARHAR